MLPFLATECIELYPSISEILADTVDFCDGNKELVAIGVEDLEIFLRDGRECLFSDGFEPPDPMIPMDDEVSRREGYEEIEVLGETPTLAIFDKNPCENIVRNAEDRWDTERILAYAE